MSHFTNEMKRSIVATEHRLIEPYETSHNGYSLSFGRRQWQKQQQHASVFAREKDDNFSFKNSELTLPGTVVKWSEKEAYREKFHETNDET